MYHHLGWLLMRFRHKDVKEWPSFHLVVILMLSLLGVALSGYIFGIAGPDLLKAADQGRWPDFWSGPFLMVAMLSIVLFYLSVVCLIFADGCRTILRKRWFGE